MNSYRTRIGLFVAVFTALALTSCVGGSESGTEQVTNDSYRAAFNAFVDCMDEAGYPVRIDDESGTVIRYSIPDAVADTPTEEECYGPFRAIDIEWQVANEDTSEDALAMRDCLTQNGVEPVGTLAGDWALIQRHGLEETC